MTPDRSTPPPSRPGRSEPWRIERMVQRVPAHLGETTHEMVPTWAVIAGVVLLVVVSCIVLSILLDVPSGLAGVSPKPGATATRTPRVVTPAVTVLPVTLPPASATPGPTAATIKYRVKAGDTLTSIAAKYHVSIQAIMTANSLKDETIRAGEDLTIPLPTPTPSSGAYLPPASPGPMASTPTIIALQAPPTSASPGSTPGVVRHIVVKGETLISIAALYGSSADSIRAANQLVGDMLSIGQVLQVPVGGWSPTAIPTTMVIPSATATLQFPYTAPSLIWPPEGQIIRGKDAAPMLQWVSSAILKADEYYVVHVDLIGAKPKSIVRQVRQGTSLQLTPADYPGASANGTTCSWYVLIVSQPKLQTESSGTLIYASSPPSEPRRFVWY